jgi:tetratricopeptide (TPR) repeat protein
MLRADRDEKLGQELFKKYKINATPTVMTIGGDGTEVDWTVGYGPPPEKFQERMEKMVAGDGTFKVLSQAFAKNPKDAATAFQLGRKWSDRYDNAKSAEYYRLVIALDPAGKSGTYMDEYRKLTVPYTEYAEFSLGGTALGGTTRDPAVMKAFIQKYPKSPLLKQAYARLSSYYSSSPSKDEATVFYAEYTAKYPEDPNVLVAWLNRITKDKGDFVKGTELADKIRLLTQGNPEPRTSQSLANFYFAKGDAEEADKVYGKDFMSDRAIFLAYDMIDYANYWVGRNTNLDAAVRAAETGLKLVPDSSYYLSQAAGVYIKAGKEDKALEIYGPAYFQKNIGNKNALSSYTAFWGNQGKNLESALEAGRKVVELSPNDYYCWYALSTVLLAKKDYDGALKAAEKAVDLADDAVKSYYQKTIDKIKAAQAAEKK